MTNNNVALGERIARLRKDMGWSQGALMRSLKAAGFQGVHQPTIARIEKGERGLSLVEAYIVADVFGVSLDELTGRKEPHHVDASAGIKESIRILTAELDRLRGGVDL